MFYKFKIARVRPSRNITKNRSNSDTNMDATSESEASSNSSTEDITTLGMSVMADTTSPVQEIKHSKPDDSTNEAYFPETVNTKSDTKYSHMSRNRELSTTHSSDQSYGNQSERENGVVQTSDNETHTSQLEQSTGIPFLVSFGNASNDLDAMGHYGNSNINEN